MSKVLICGNDRELCLKIKESAKSRTDLFDEAEVAESLAEFEKITKECAFDTFIAVCEEDFIWEELLLKLRGLDGNICFIALCNDEDFKTLYRIAELKAKGVALAMDWKEGIARIFDNLSKERSAAQFLSDFITNENINDKIYFHLNGNDMPYFEQLFDCLKVCRESRENVTAVCTKLVGVIYDYLESQGFKSARFQRSGAIRTLSEFKHLSEIIQYTRERYFNILQFETQKNQDYYHAIADNIREFIDVNYAGDAMCVPKIAERFHFSANYVNGIFKSQMGRTIPNYITEVRLSAAKRLLTETKEPISDIATRVGYSRLTYFSRIFKNKYNISPIDYRNKFSPGSAKSISG